MKKKGVRNLVNAIQVLLYGLESSGKSTMVKSFQEGHFTQGIPFTAQKYYEISLNANIKVNFDILEVGGGRAVRRIAVENIDQVEAIIFVIDGSNEGSFKDAKTEFEKILQHPHSRSKPIAILFNKKDIAEVHPAVIIEKFNLLDRIDRPHKVFSTTAKNNQDFGQVLYWIHKCLTREKEDSLLEDKATRFYKIYILDMLNTQKKGLPILAILSQLDIFSRTGHVSYDRDKIMVILRKLLSSGDIEYIEQLKIWRITGKGQKRIEGSELDKSDKYEDLKEFLDKSSAVRSSDDPKASSDKGKENILDAFELDELAELYKKSTSQKRKK